MARAVDPKRTRKALKALAALKAAANDDSAPAAFSDWEDTFITQVSERLEKFGSAFADYGKGAPEEALSRLQQQKLQELRKKTRKPSNVNADQPSGTPQKRGLSRGKGFQRQGLRPKE